MSDPTQPRRAEQGMSPKELEIERIRDKHIRMALVLNWGCGVFAGAALGACTALLFSLPILQSTAVGIVSGLVVAYLNQRIRFPAILREYDSRLDGIFQSPKNRRNKRRRKVWQTAVAYGAE